MYKKILALLLSLLLTAAPVTALALEGGTPPEPTVNIESPGEVPEPEPEPEPEPGSDQDTPPEPEKDSDTLPDPNEPNGLPKKLAPPEEGESLTAVVGPLTIQWSEDRSSAELVQTDRKTHV